METTIENLRQAGATAQAMAVSLGGLIGVFATLTVFFMIIWLADKIGANKQA